MAGWLLTPHWTTCELLCWACVNNCRLLETLVKANHYALLNRAHSVDIPTSDYERCRSVLQWCDWINDKLRDLKECSDFEERYFERRVQNV